MARDDDDEPVPGCRVQAENDDVLRRRKFADDAARDAALAMQAALDRSAAAMPNPFTDSRVVAIWSHDKPR